MPIEHHTLERDQLHWHVVTSGAPDAPPLLLLHCWTGNWTLWEKTIEVLSANFRVIAPDHLGFGQSDKPRGDHYGIEEQAERVLYILKHFGYERACVMGHSMGGQIALTFSGMYPEAIEQLIVVDPAVTGKIHWLAQPSRLWMYLVRHGMAVTVERLIRFAVQRLPALTLQLARIYFYRPFKHREAALYWSQQIVADGQIHSSAWAEYSILTHDVTPLLKNIAAPTLAIWGIEDYCVPISECRVLQKHIQNIQVLHIPKIGHFPMIEAWPEFQSATTKFLSA